MATKKLPKQRILAWDISLSAPGVALLELNPNDGTIRLIEVSSCITDAKMTTAERSHHIEAWAYMFLFKHRKVGFDHIVRESYQSKFGHHTIFSAWAAIDKALIWYGLEITEKPIAQSRVKSLVVGKGKAEKTEVEAGARKFLVDGDAVVFANDNESDAVAVGLAYLVDRGIIKPMFEPKPKAGRVAKK